MHTLIYSYSYKYLSTFVQIHLSTILCNLEAESRNTVFSRKYFQPQYLLNFPFNWGLEITRICLFYFHLKLVEGANCGLNFFVLFAIDARNLSSINDHMFFLRKGFYFYERGVQLYHLNHVLLQFIRFADEQSLIFFFEFKNTEVLK